MATLVDYNANESHYKRVKHTMTHCFFFSIESHYYTKVKVNPIEEQDCYTINLACDANEFFREPNIILRAKVLAFVRELTRRKILRSRKLSKLRIKISLSLNRVTNMKLPYLKRISVLTKCLVR